MAKEVGESRFECIFVGDLCPVFEKYRDGQEDTGCTVYLSFLVPIIGNPGERALGLFSNIANNRFL